MLQSIDKFHKKRLGYLVFGLVELMLSYVLVRWAFPSGDWWEWLLALVLMVGALQNFTRMLARTKK